MRNPDDFDAFYKAARHRLLLQTYALTGDLPAARGAVRDAFVHAWHHWRKVSRLEDPESWVRPTPGSMPSVGTPPASGTATSPSTRSCAQPWTHWPS